MVRITVAGEDLDLFKGFTIPIEETSPIFNDIGSQSIAVGLPDTPRNRRILAFPRRPDAAGNRRSTSVGCTVTSGAYQRSGILNADSASDREISVSIGFGNSMAYDAWRSCRLSELDTLPCWRFRDMDAVANEMRRLFTGADPQTDDLTVFPVCIGEEEIKEKLDGEPKEGETYFEILNNFHEDNDIFLPAGEKERRMMRVIDGSEAMITVPNGYGCTPFVRVWRILEAVFSDLGLLMDRNPFREDGQLARLVVLNNTADSLCACTLDYAELMPDCTVEEFLNALFVRFGLVYRTDFDSGIAHIRLVREIMGRTPSLDLDPYLTKAPETEMRSPQYVRLSAATSIEGAAPSTSRLEDFIPDYSLFGKDEPEKEEASSGTGEAGPKPDFWRIDRTDWRPPSAFLPYWEGYTGTLWRQDVWGYGGGGSSSSFFVWDPQPDGCEPMDLASADECCPVRLIGPFSGGGRDHSYFWPAFTVGARHRHTYTKSSAAEKDSECPLSFMFALQYDSGTPYAGYTEGLLSAYRYEDEGPIYGDDGSPFRLSLYFQLSIGHYVWFWKDFDRMLRDADRRVSVSVRMEGVKLRSLDVLTPVRLGGVPMLIDTADTVIGDGPYATADMVLIPMMPPFDGEARYGGEIPDCPRDPDVLSGDEDDS